MALTGAQLVVQGLLEEGVDTVFGIPGSHVLAIYDALREALQIRHVTAVHENNAALMAGVYARLTGKPGVAVVTAGPGATNAATGIAQAYSSAFPVVIITGSVPPKAKKEIFHGVDDPEFLHKIFSPITKLSFRIERPEEVPEKLAQAFSQALSGRPGPVHVEIDELVLKGEVGE
ncbi:MAG TPA: thiamine pyrophosphate-binding protein, partial [Dehalococcoidia bacterium]|nr:thiamine pyrophosphate-binding protein [Dehalococcoidia bacterium]